MEHLQHFGLSHDPFSNESDLRLYFDSPCHRDAQRRVERGLRQHKGLTLLTGEGGMGKTLLARRILDGLEEELFEATLLVMLPGAADAMGIFQRFARQLGADEPARDRAGVLSQIFERLAIVREDGRHAVLIVDDAQVMSPQVFAELGGLLSLEYEDRRLMSMLFVGSPELDRQIQNDASLMPRVDVRVRLQPLDANAAAAYLMHRLSVARGHQGLLPPATLDALYKFGRGRPRLLNTLADNALFEAYLAGRSAIDPGDVERAAADLGLERGEVATALPAPVRPPVLRNEPRVEALAPSPPPVRRPDPTTALEPMTAGEPSWDDAALDEIDLELLVPDPTPAAPAIPARGGVRPAAPMPGVAKEPARPATRESDPFAPLFESDGVAEVDGLFVELIEE